MNAATAERSCFDKLSTSGRHNLSVNGRDDGNTTGRDKLVTNRRPTVRPERHASDTVEG